MLLGTPTSSIWSTAWQFQYVAKYQLAWHFPARRRHLRGAFYSLFQLCSISAERLAPWCFHFFYYTVESHYNNLLYVNIQPSYVEISVLVYARNQRKLKTVASYRHKLNLHACVFRAKWSFITCAPQGARLFVRAKRNFVISAFVLSCRKLYSILWALCWDHSGVFVLSRILYLPCSL